MMKLSVFYDHILRAHEQSGKSIPELLGLCRFLGIEGLEMEYTLFDKNRDSISAMLSEAGISISCFYDFFEFQKSGSLSKAERMLETASGLQVSRVLLVPGVLEAEEAAELSACSENYEAVSCFMDSNCGIQNMKRALSNLTAYGAVLGVNVMLENFDGFVQPFSGMNQLLWFMKNVPGLGYTLDMGNFAFSNEDVIRAADLLKDYIVHVHCKDRAINPSVKGAFCKGLSPSPAGRGYLPIQELIGVLKDRGYDGYLAIEHFGAFDQLSYILKSAGFLKRCAGIRSGSYLYHGSPFKAESLQPRQAHDTEYEAGCQEAVYATDDIDMAVCFALGVEGGGDSQRIMMPEYGMKMLFKNCRPRYGQKGYVYILSKDEFVHAMGSQWAAYSVQRPVCRIEINVDDYVEDYCIIEEPR